MFYRGMLLGVSLLAVVCGGTLRAADPPPSFNGGGVTIDLKTQLEKGLRARRPVEFAYIDQIIKMVEDKKLPLELVQSTFLWARRKQSRQLQYFQFALQFRAKQLGIDTPLLNDQAVGISDNGGQHGVNVP